MNLAGVANSSAATMAQQSVAVARKVLDAQVIEGIAAIGLIATAGQVGKGGSAGPTPAPAPRGDGTGTKVDVTA